MQAPRSLAPVLCVAIALIAFPGPVTAELLIGWSSTSITPDKPVALSGQFHTRISKYVHDPVTATALAIEAKSANAVVDQAIMVSCDLVRVTAEIQSRLRERLKGELTDFNVEKLFLSATHTHTAPVVRDGQYQIPEQGVIQPAEYVDFLLDQLTVAATQAWRTRKPGGVSWSLAHAVVGYNRRAVYSGGEATMYGKTAVGDFTHLEGYEDHGVELLFFWNRDQRLTGVVINIACPSQVVESKWYVSADFWHDVREKLRTRYSDDLFVYPMTGASGDQSPHLMFRRAAEETLRRRRGVSETEEIADRIVTALDRVFADAKGDIRTEVPFTHKVEQLDLPVRKVTKAEYAEARREYDQWIKAPESDEKRHRLLQRHEDVIERYQRQEKELFHRMELHVIRLGDISIATNPFELFLDFGIQIKARSVAEQTFVVQLACDYSGYLPTARAVEAGGYGAEITSNYVGPEGGKVLVDRSVELINAMWGHQ